MLVIPNRFSGEEPAFLSTPQKSRFLTPEGVRNDIAWGFELATLAPVEQLSGKQKPLPRSGRGLRLEQPG